MDESINVVENVEALRRAFDDSFAIAHEAGDDFEEYLAIRVADQPFAVRITELSRIEAKHKVVALPAANGDLLGIAGIQGRLVPVFQFATILGLGSSPTATSWIAIDRGAEPVGLAFDGLEGFLRLPRAEPVDAAGAGFAGDFVRQAVSGPEGVRLVVSIPEIVDAIRRRMSAGNEATREF